MTYLRDSSLAQNDTVVEHKTMDEFASHIITACSIYLPADRRMALARGVQLPERTHGAALFADISGFTPLTEALTQTLGLRRGAEELPQHLNRVYAALVAEVDRYGDRDTGPIAGHTVRQGGGGQRPGLSLCRGRPGGRRVSAFWRH